MSDMTDWMTEEDGIPHKDGKVRWYVVGPEEDMYGYLGWHDMTDWYKGLEEVMFDAKQIACDSFNFQVLRHDQLITLLRNVYFAIEEALDVPGETTYNYWLKRRVAALQAQKLRGDSQE